MVSPIGIGGQAYWDSLRSLHSGIGPLTELERSLPTLSFGGRITDFDPKQHVRPRKALKVMCREIQTAFAAATLAIGDASLHSESYKPARMATVFGSEMMSGEPDELAETMLECGVQSGLPDVTKFGEAAMRKVFPLWMLKYLPNMATCHVGIALGAEGPNNSLVLGDSSGLAALYETVSVLDRGGADCVICGGAGTKISPVRMIYNHDLPIASRREPIEDSSRPFAHDRDGMVGGEAAAMLILEQAEKAACRGARSLGFVEGLALRFIPPESPSHGPERAIEQAMRAALATAGCGKERIGAVVSHAFGHPVQDRAEAQAIAAVFGNAMPVVAPMAAVGHSGAASGSLALVTAALMLHHRTIPPTRHALARAPECPVQLLQVPKPLNDASVLVLSHTMLGNAAAAILGPLR